MTTTPLYDAFSGDYDRFVDWQSRLAYELPFIERQLSSIGAERVLDAACGTGMHAIALAKRGYRLAGADLSSGMVERARANAAGAGLDIPFTVAGFGELATRVDRKLDALLCLGNSLPHVLTTADLAGTLTDFAAVLRPGGLLFIQNRNFDAVMEAGGERWMGPQGVQEGNREWLFLRFYDFNPDGTLVFNVLTLRREDDGAWTQSVEATLLRPWLQADLEEMVVAAGFGDLAWYGDMTGAPFEPESSGNLILTAVREPIP
jgi:SAM-dependent methyltransferase